MSKGIAKIHCLNKNDKGFTLCGRLHYVVLNVGGYIFDMIKDKHKCKRCKKAWNRRANK